MNNIILIGMPGAGKSTIGVLLAKTIQYDFLDTDLLIQKKSGGKLIELMHKDGVKGFLSLENSILTELRCENTVVATGGSAVYGKTAMENLKSLGTVVYLKLDSAEICRRVKNIRTRGIVMHKGQTLEELFNEREPLYEKYDDVTVDCNGLDTEACIEIITEKLMK